MFDSSTLPAKSCHLTPTLLPTRPPLRQALEKTAAEGAPIEQYEIEGPDRAELLMDLAELQLATVSRFLFVLIIAVGVRASC